MSSHLKLLDKNAGLYILAIPPQIEREEFEGGLHEKRKGKGGGERRKKKSVIKHTLKYLCEA